MSQDRLCESSPQVMGYIMVGSLINTNLEAFSWKLY